MAYLNNPKLEYAGGRFPEFVHLNEADSQSFLVGQFVYDAGAGTAGQITAYATDGALILGIAHAPGTNVTSSHTSIPVELVRAGDRIRIRCTTNGTDTLSNTLLTGKGYGSYVASNVCYLDANDTSNDRFVFEAPIYDENGNATYWCYARLIDEIAQFEKGV